MVSADSCQKYFPLKKFQLPKSVQLAEWQTPALEKPENLTDTGVSRRLIMCITCIIMKINRGTRLFYLSLMWCRIQLLSCVGRICRGQGCCGGAEALLPQLAVGDDLHGADKTPAHSTR
jgi:hypothetical protein